MDVCKICVTLILDIRSLVGAPVCTKDTDSAPEIFISRLLQILMAHVRNV